jgi:hypothetical protein
MHRIASNHKSLRHYRIVSILSTLPFLVSMHVQSLQPHDPPSFKLIGPPIALSQLKSHSTISLTFLLMCCKIHSPSLLSVSQSRSHARHSSHVLLLISSSIIIIIVITSSTYRWLRPCPPSPRSERIPTSLYGRPDLQVLSHLLTPTQFNKGVDMGKRKTHTIRIVYSDPPRSQAPRE